MKLFPIKAYFVSIALLFPFLLSAKQVKVGVVLKERKIYVSSNKPILVFKGKRRIYRIPAGEKVFFWTKKTGKRLKKSSGWYIQVGAFKKDSSIRKCSRQLAAITDLEPKIVKSSNGFYLVRLGPFETLSSASALKDTLKMNGFPDVFIVSSSLKEGRQAVYLINGEYDKKLLSRSPIRLKSKGLIKVNGTRYRGEIIISLYNGKLNAINVVSVEDYLKGVVPAEMSPNLYPDIEALKAQAVAARTYVYYNLGQFKQMGFDICATQSCQVYKGYDAENDLTNQAVDETAGEIIVYNGKPVNALFTAYCGGHTENVEKVFGGAPVPYLKGVVCEGEGSFPHKIISAKKVLEPSYTPYVSRPYLAISVLLAEGLLKESEIDNLNSDAGKGFSLVFLNRVLGFLGIKPKNIPLISDKLSDIGLYLSEQIYGVDTLKPLFESQILVQDLPDISAKKIDLIGIAYSLVKSFEKIEYYGLDFMVVDKDFLFALENPEFLFINQGRVEISVPVATVRVGDRIRVVYDKNNIPLAVVIVTPESQNAVNDSFLSGYSWYAFLTEEEINERAKRYGFNKPVKDIEVVEITDTGRVVKIKVKSKNDYAVFTGLRIRWFFKVKENKFVLYKRFDKEGNLKGVYLVGNAWGHGVGMCQIGAFGLALKGWDYKKILKHYYTGVEIENAEKR